MNEMATSTLLGAARIYVKARPVRRDGAIPRIYARFGLSGTGPVEFVDPRTRAPIDLGLYDETVLDEVRDRARRTIGKLAAGPVRTARAGPVTARCTQACTTGP